MLSKGQGATMGTYDTLLLAFDMDNRVDEAESLWNMVLLTHTRSISKQLFSRMISLYDHHNMQVKIIEVCQSPTKMPYDTSLQSLFDSSNLILRIFYQMKLAKACFGCKLLVFLFEGICRHGGVVCKTR